MDIIIQGLDRDPVRALEQALFLAVCAVNRYRNQEGTGHGRPHLSRASEDQARPAGNVAGVVTTMLLASLELQSTRVRHPDEPSKWPSKHSTRRFVSR